MTLQPIDRRRVADMVVVLQQLAGPDSRARLTPSPADDELDQVAHGINRLADQLSELHRAVDRRVADRTAELLTARAELEWRAQVDELTGLANRSQLSDRIRDAVARSPRPGERPSVLLLDLDGFKNINDGLGHSAGDAVLIEVASRLRECVRPSDTVARLGGDEFAIVLPDSDAAGAVAVAHRILEQLRRPIRIGWRTVWTGASIGVYPAERGQSVERVLRNADTAMYAAKAAGRGQVRQFRPQMHAAAQQRLRTASEIAAALAGEHLRVHYCPQIDLRSRRVTAVEAVVRWPHPRRGLLRAAEFIDVAEDSGHVIEMGRWVRRTAIDRFAAWLLADEGPATRMRMHLHLSAVELRTTGWADELLAAIAGARIDAHRLVVVLPEATLASGEGTVDLRRIRREGVGVLADGFGTGTTSLAAFRRRPVDAVRVDAALVAAAAEDRREAAYLSSLVALARSLDLRVMASGVDSAEQARMLAAMGCPTGQGIWCGSEASADLVPATRWTGSRRPASPGPTVRAAG